MAVSKRLRFEIFRRDNFTCRYCGESAPDVPLRVDHVIPVALGGGDEPTNLVTSCRPCNDGKSSTSPDDAVVDDVEQDALRWARAMQRAAKIQQNQQDVFQDYVRWFDGWWGAWQHGDEEEPLPLPSDYTQTLHRFFVLGLEPRFIEYAVRTAMQASQVKIRNVFRYFAGVCWRHLEERQDIAASLLSKEGDDGGT